MTLYLNLLLLGLGAGGMYALSAMGLLVVYRSSGVVNFAQCAIGMIGAWGYYEFVDQLHWAVFPAIIVCTLMSVVTGLVTYEIAIRPLRQASALTMAISTLAVLLVIDALTQLRFGAQSVVPKGAISARRLSLVGGIYINEDRLVLFLLASGVAVALAFLYRATRFGLATSGLAENPLALQALGWRIGRQRLINWALAGGLSGLSTILLVPIVGLNVDVSTSLLIPALAAALVGNMTSFGAAFAGGIAIGVVQAELQQYSTSVQGLPDAVPFLLIVLLLVARGKGLPGRGTSAMRLPSVGTGVFRPITVCVATVVAGLLLTYAAGQSWQYSVTTSLLEAIVLLSLVVTTGYGGQLSLAQVTFAGVAALAAAQFIARFDMPYLVAFLLAVAVTVPVGVLVGLPSARTRGITLGLVTFGLAVAVNSLVFDNNWLTNSGDGIDITHGGTHEVNLFGYDIDPLNHPGRYAIAVLLVFVAVAIVVTNIRRGRAGLRLLSVRANERAAAALGHNSTSAKLWAFGYGAGIAAVGGVLLAYQNPAVEFTTYGVLPNIQAVGYIVVGGIGSVLGPLVGGLLPDGGVGYQAMSAISQSWSSYVDLVGACLLLITVLTSANGVIEAYASRLRGRTAGLRGRMARYGTAQRRGRGVGASGDAVRFEEDADAFDAAAQSAGAGSGGPETLYIDDLSVSFGGVHALSNVTFEVTPGLVTAVIGPNGSGKTTLIDAVTGFAAARGAVRLGSRRIDGLPAYQRARRGIGRSFQSLELFEDLTVAENLRAGSDLHRRSQYLSDLIWPRRWKDDARLAAHLDRFGIDPRTALALPAALPYGHRRLLAVARALMTRPRILFLDEPCAGLDREDRVRLCRIMRRLVEGGQLAIVLVEHDVEVVRAAADRVVALDFGSVVAEGPPDVVLSDPAVVAAYLGAQDNAADSTSVDLSGGAR